MTIARELPEPLRDRGFTLAQLRDHGEHPSRAWRSDIVRLDSGVYAHRDLVESSGEIQLYRLRALALAREYQHAWVCHSTALLLLGCPVPRNVKCGSPVHLSVPSSSPAVARSGVRSHRVRLGAENVMRHPLIRWLRTSSPERLWLEMAGTLSLDGLVAVGDSLVREPYYWAEQRHEPYTTVESLRQMLRDSGGSRGVRRAREALSLIRMGADSPKETAFRVALIDGGMPEPQLQVPLDPAQPGSRRADAGYPEYKIAIQYDGATHFTPDRARADQRRDNEFVAAGWMVLRFNVADDREGFVTAIRQLKTALIGRGWHP